MESATCKNCGKYIVKLADIWKHAEMKCNTSVAEPVEEDD